MFRSRIISSLSNYQKKAKTTEAVNKEQRIGSFLNIFWRQNTQESCFIGDFLGKNIKTENQTED